MNELVSNFCRWRTSSKPSNLIAFSKTKKAPKRLSHCFIGADDQI
jgi:hypothetical protein